MFQSILFIFALCLLISFILSEIFNRMKYPRIIGQIFAGMVLSFPFFRVLFTDDILVDINFLSELGMVFLLMLAGLEINLRKLHKAEKNAVLTGIFCAIIPLIIGYIFAKSIGYSDTAAFVLGACLGLTAEGTTINILMELNVLNTRIGTIIIGAGIIDDLFEVLFLSVILIIAHRDMMQLALFPLKLLAFIILAILIFKLIPGLIKFIQKEKSRTATFSTILIIGLIIALISQGLGLGPIIGAFIAGIFIQLSDRNKSDEREIVEELKILTFSFVVPFLFINIGLQMNFHMLLANIWTVIIILIIAMIGKIGGALLVTPFSDLSLKQTHLIGWGMNSRGATELVIAEIARVNGLIPIEIYSAIVIMAVTTTLMFPFVLKATIKKYPTIMN